MMSIDISEIPSTEICIDNNWFYVPNYVFTDSPEDYKNPIQTKSWRNEDGTNMYNQPQKFIMRGSYAGLLEISAKKDNGKFCYKYYLASKIGKKIGKIFKKTGRRFFYITTRQNQDDLWQVTKKIESNLIWSFLKEVNGDYSDMARVGRSTTKSGLTLITFSYYNKIDYEILKSVDKLKASLGELL